MVDDDDTPAFAVINNKTELIPSTVGGTTPPPSPVSDLESEVYSGSESEEEESGPMEVSKFQHDGKTYFRSDEGFLFDPETESPIGRWNEEDQVIET